MSQSSLSAKGNVLVSDGPPVLMRERVSVAVQIFERTFYKKDDFAVFLQHQRMNGAGFRERCHRPAISNRVRDTATRHAVSARGPTRSGGESPDCHPPALSVLRSSGRSWDQPGSVALHIRLP